jgi:hypothetical protein
MPAIDNSQIINTAPLVTSNGSGQFMLNGQTYTVSDIMNLIQAVRLKNQDDRLATMLEDMVLTNKKLTDGRNILQALRATMNSMDDDDKIQMTPEQIKYFEDNGIQQGLSEWDREHKNHDQSDRGIYTGKNGYDYNHDKEQYETSIKNLTASMENTNQNSQMEMLNINSAIKNRDQAFQLMMEVIKKQDQANSSIIRAIN